MSSIIIIINVTNLPTKRSVKCDKSIVVCCCCRGDQTVCVGVVISREDCSDSTERASDTEDVLILRSCWIVFMDLCTVYGQ